MEQSDLYKIFNVATPFEIKSVTKVSIYLKVLADRIIYRERVYVVNIGYKSTEKHRIALYSNVKSVMMMMMMMMMMMNCFCGMVDRRKAFSLISSRDHCQRSSPLRISDTLRARFEPAQNLSTGLVE